MRTAIALLLVIPLVLPLTALADEEDGGKQVPATPEALPYVDAQAVATQLGEIAQTVGPAAAELIDYGRSAGGRTLHALRLGPSDRPVVFVHGGLGPRDCAGTVACLALARRVAADLATHTAEVSWLFVPAPNPDGLDAFLARRARPGAAGVNVDRDRDGARGEDGPSDIDGDGLILRMRRMTRLGGWTVKDDPPKEEEGKEPRPRSDPRWMTNVGRDVRRDISYEVTDEGLDDDGDGEVGEDPPGLDLRRQLTGWWDNQGPWKGDGPFAGYAPEARWLMELSLRQVRLLAWWGFTSEGRHVLRANAAGDVNEVDKPLYHEIAKALKERIGLQTKRAAAIASERGNPGCDLDWAAVHLGVPALRVPVWSIPREEANGRDDKEVTELDWLLWNDRTLKGAGFVPWRAFDHPTLGKVEVGGWKPFTRHEPPAAQLGTAVAAVVEGPLVQAAFRPRLEVDVEVKPQGEDVWLVTARVLNGGGAPTDTPSSVKRRRAMGVRIRLEPDSDAQVLGGPPEGDVGTVKAGQASETVTWTVRKSGGGLLGGVTARHRVAGSTTARVHTP